MGKQITFAMHLRHLVEKCWLRVTGTSFICIIQSWKLTLWEKGASRKSVSTLTSSFVAPHKSSCSLQGLEVSEWCVESHFAPIRSFTLSKIIVIIKSNCSWVKVFFLVHRSLLNSVTYLTNTESLKVKVKVKVESLKDHPLNVTVRYQLSVKHSSI